MPKTWYVNLAPNAKQAAGPEVPVKVTRSVVSKYDANRTVAWTCVGDRNNLNTVDEDASWKTGDGSGTQTSIVKEHDNSRKFHNTLKLPVYGGDKYTLSAQRSDKRGPSLTETIEVRRKLFYMTNWMNTEGKKLLEVVEPTIRRIFAAVGIDLERVDRRKISERALLTEDAVEPLVTGHPAPPQQVTGQLMRLVVVPQFCAVREFDAELPLEDGFGADLGQYADTIAYVSGAWQITAHLPAEDNLKSHRQIRLGTPPSVKVAIAQFHECSSVVRTQWFDNGTELPCDVTRIDERTVRIRIRDGNFPNNANLVRLAELRATAHKDKAWSHDYFTGQPSDGTLHLEVKVQGIRPIGGQSNGPNIALTQDMTMYYSRAGRARRGAGLAGIFAHEIGHAIGLVPETIKLNGATQAHGSYYGEINGGKGTHCHTNAVLKDNTPDAAGDFYYPDNESCVQVYTPEGAICIMYHQRTDQLHALEFCDNCKRTLRAVDLSAGALKQKKWHKVY